MSNVIPVYELTANRRTEHEPIRCPICRDCFESDENKAQHLERAHPGWAALMMLGYLQQIPRENG